MMNKQQFADSLAALVSGEGVRCHGDPERFGHMIERLAASLGFTIALASGGDGKTISRMMHGAESYAMEEAVQKSVFAKLMNTSQSPRKLG